MPKDDRSKLLKKQKLSLNKKSKTPQGELFNVLTLPSALNETSDFQQTIDTVHLISSTRSLKQRNNKAQNACEGQLKQSVEDTKQNIQKCKAVDQDNRKHVLELNRQQGKNRSGGTTQCPSCNNTLATSDMPSHLHQCLQQFERTSTVKDADIQEKIDPKNQMCFCHICKKNLSHLSCQRKTQHINTCMDKEQLEKNEEENKKQSLEKAKNAVLDCPMCGKPFKTESSRKIHLKKCALTYKVNTDQMLKLIKNQEEERHLKLAAGIFPIQSRKKNSSAEKIASNVVKQKKIKEPKNQFEEELQMAMALSCSLKKEKDCEDLRMGEIDKDQDRDHTSETAIRSVMGISNLKKNRKKKIPLNQPVLVTLSDEERKKRMEDKVSLILMPQEDEDEEIEQTPDFELSKWTTGTESVHSSTHSDLWIRASTKSKESHEEVFYVESLVPPIEVNRVKTGSKMRRMSEIPGRRTSVIRHPSLPNQTQIQTDDTMLVSTQTAVVLAELAADDIEGNADLSVLHSSGFCPEQSIKLPNVIQESLPRHLQQSMISLVNNSLLSDVKILTSGSSVIHAHSLVLAVRSPELLQNKLDATINLPDVTFDVMLSVLKYIYAGEISFGTSLLPDVLIFAERFKLAELADICKQVKPANIDNCQLIDNEVSCASKDTDDNLHRGDLHDLLQDFFDDSSDDEEHSHDKVKGQSDSSSEISDSDYNDIMCSQRIKLASCNNNISSPKKITNDENRKIQYSDIKTVESVEEIEKNIRNTTNTPMEIEENEGYSKNSNNAVEDPNSSHDINITDTESGGKDGDMHSDRNFNVQEQCNIQLAVVKSRSMGQALPISSNTLETSKLHIDMSCMNKSLIYEDDDMEVFSAPNSDQSEPSSQKTEASQEYAIVSNQLTDDGHNDDYYVEEEKQTAGKHDDDIVIICSDESNQEAASYNNHIVPACNLGNKTTSPARHHQQDSVETPIESYSDEENLQGNYVLEATPGHSLPTMSAQYLMDTSPIKSPEIDICLTISDEEDAVNSQKLYRSPSNHSKRKRRSSPKKKSPVVLSKSPKERKKSVNDSMSNLELSGADLFDSPSPCVKRQKFEHYSSDKNSSFEHNISPVLSKHKDSGISHARRALHVGADFCQTENSTDSDVQNDVCVINSGKISACVDTIVKTQGEVNGNTGGEIDGAFPETNREDKNGNRIREHLCSGNKDKQDSVENYDKFSQQDRKIPQEHKLECDVQIIDDNFTKDSQSPTFAQKDKKRWKFTKRNIVAVPNGSFTTDHKDKEKDLSSPELTIIRDLSPGEQLENDMMTADTVEPSGSFDVPADDIWDGFNDSGAQFTSLLTCNTPPESTLDKNTPIPKVSSTSDLPISSKYSETTCKNDSTVSTDILNSSESSHHGDDKHSTISNHGNTSLSSPHIAGDLVTGNASLDADVWDGFDDSGGAFTGVMSPGTDNYELTEQMTSTRTKPADKEPSYGDVNEDEMNSAVIGNDSLLLNESNVGLNAVGIQPTLSHGTIKPSFKTPVTTTKPESFTKKWIPPSPFTPMADYDHMNTPLLKREVHKFGIKPVGKKRMIQALKDIYQQTHQYETDSEFEQSFEEVKQPMSLITGGSASDEDFRGNGHSDDEEEDGTDLNSSQDSVRSDLIEESFMHEHNEDIQATQQDGKQLSEKLFEFLQSRKDILTMIMMYEPLEIDWLKKQVTEAGVKCSMDKLLQYLDQKCITFTMKKMRQERISKRGRVHKSPKKKGEGSPRKNSSPNKLKETPKKRRQAKSKKTPKKKKVQKQ